jgi:hypothetical protein
VRTSLARPFVRKCTPHYLHRMLRPLLRVVFALAAATTLGSQTQPRPFAGGFAVEDPLHAAGRDVTVSLLTMGNGDKVWELFGHSAIWIHDNTTGRDTVFNWGVFDSTKPHFILNFLKGLMLYQMGGETVQQLLTDYRYFNRTVVAQELNLTAPEKDSLLRLIQVNALPQNLQYRYDYFRDNCSTRPRDLLDRALGGLLRAHSSDTTNRSYRWHTLRLMQGDKPLVVGVDVGLGEPSDRPVTRWDEMFLPRQLHDLLNTLQVRDSVGTLRPLVARDTVLFQSSRPAEAQSPPNLAPWLLAIGLVVAVVLGWFGVRVRVRAGRRAPSRAARLSAATLFGVWSLVAGVLGVVLTILWAATDHAFAHSNEDLLLFNPLWLLLVVLIPVYFLTGRAARLTRAVSLGLALLALAALVAHGVRLSRQQNLAIIGLALPPALVIAWTVNRVRDTRFRSR